MGYPKITPCCFGPPPAKFCFLQKQCNTSAWKKQHNTFKKSNLNTFREKIQLNVTLKTCRFIKDRVRCSFRWKMSRGICHWGPLLALSIIWTLFLCGIYCILLWYPPWTSAASVIHLIFYVSWMILIMNYFIKSVTLGPGYLPLEWRPVSSVN